MFFCDQAAEWLESDRLFWPSQRLVSGRYPHAWEPNGLCAIYSDNGDDSTRSTEPSGWDSWYKIGSGSLCPVLLPWMPRVRAGRGSSCPSAAPESCDAPKGSRIGQEPRRLGGRR
jgi:hypothetical protein